MIADGEAVLSEDNIRHGAVALLTALVALGSISVSIYIPALPEISRTLQASQAETEATLTAFLVTFAVGQLLYGSLADRIGRKPPLIGGLLLYGAGSAACALAPSITFLILARICQALGASAGPALGRAMMRDLYEGRPLTSAMAKVSAAIALSPMVGPAFGGFLADVFGWRWMFLLLTALSLLLAALVLCRLPETRPAEGRLTTNPVSGYVLLLGDEEFRSAVLCGGLLTAGNFAWNAATPFLFANHFGISPEIYGADALVVGGGYLAGTLAAAWAGRFVAPEQLVYGGLSLTVLAGLAMTAAGLPGSVWMLIAPMVIFTVGMGIVIPAAASCALSRLPGQAGAAAGLLGAIQILTGAIGAAIGGAETSLRLLEIEIVSASVAAAGVGHIALAPLRRKNKPAP